MPAAVPADHCLHDTQEVSGVATTEKPLLSIDLAPLRHNFAADYVASRYPSHE